MGQIIFVALSLLAGLISVLKILWLEANVEISLVASIIIAQGILFLAAYSDFGLNQGILYIGMERKVRTERQTVLNLIGSSSTKIFVFLFSFFTIFFPFVILSVGDYGFEPNSLLNLTFLTILYLVALSLNNYLQVYLRVSEKLAILGLFSFASNALSFALLYFYYYLKFPLSLSPILLIHPISIIILFFCFFGFSNLKLKFFKRRSYPWKVICFIALKGFYVSIIGILFGYFILFDRIMVNKYSVEDGRYTYVFFTVFGGICITVSGYIYQAIFRKFFNNADQKLSGDRDLVKIFLIVSSLSVILFYAFSLAVIAKFYPSHFIHWEYLGINLLIGLSALTIGFVNQYLLANFYHKKVLFLNVFLIGGYITLFHLLLSYEYLMLKNYILGLSSFSLSVIFLEILRRRSDFSTWYHSIQSSAAIILLSASLYVS